YEAVSTGRYTVKFAGDATAKSTVVTEFDIKATAEAKSGATTYMMALEGTTGTQAGRVWWVVPDGTKLRAPGIATLTEENESFADQWYSMKVVYDIETGKTDWYSAKLGEELKYRGSYTQLLADADKTNIGRINIQGSSGFYLDNLRVYEAVSAGELTTLISKAKSAIEATQIISPAPVTYSEDAIAALDLAVMDAESALLCATSAEDIAAATANLREAYQTFLASGMDKKNQTEVFCADFSESGDFADYMVLFTEGNSIVEKAVIEDRDALHLQSFQTNYARFIRDLKELGYNKYVFRTSFLQEEKTAVHQMATVFSGSFNETNTVFEIYSDGTNLNLRYADTVSGYASVATMKVATLVENYDVNTWYDIEVQFDMTDRTMNVLLDGVPVLMDRALYFAGAGSTSDTSVIRAGGYALPGQAYYMSEFSLVADESASIIDAYKLIGEAIPAGTGRELWRELPETVGNYTVTYESEDFDVSYDHTIKKLLAFSTFGETETTGTLVAKIDVDGTVYSFSYELPIGAAYTGTVLDHNYDVEEGTKATAIDPAYWTAAGEIASVTTVDGVEGGVLSFDGQRTLYSVPEEKRPAGISVVSLKFMAPEGDISDVAGHIVSISGKDGKGAIEVSLFDGNICISPGDYIDFDQFPGGYATMKAPILTNYEAGKWYDIKVLMNFNTRTYKVTVDGNPTLNNRAITIADTVRDVGRLSIRASAGSKFYIDDLKIYTTDFAEVKGIESLTIKQDERGETAKVIYPSSFDSNGEMIADDYTFTIEGEDTAGIRISKTGAVAVAPTAKEGEYTITATSVYDSTKSVSTKLTVIGTDYAVTEFSITSDGEAIEAVTPGMNVVAKAVVSRNRDAVKSNKVQIILVQYDADKKIVQAKVGETEFTENGVNKDVTADFTAIGEDTEGHTLRAFLMYGNMIYPITSSINAF
ncbi:MAG: hypothetical protein II354_03475, partial [Firmicutes bacterium]|nr:hypothetical protein [Bacillota bacterium]